MTGRAEARPRETGSLFCDACLRSVQQLKREATRGGEAWWAHQQPLFLYLSGSGVENDVNSLEQHPRGNSGALSEEVLSHSCEHPCAPGGTEDDVWGKAWT